MTPAQAAGDDSRLFEIGDIVKVVEEWGAGQEKLTARSVEEKDKIAVFLQE